MEVSKLQTVFKATQINKQPTSVTAFEGSNKTFEENNYMMSENIAIPIQDGNRRRQFEQDIVNMSTDFNQTDVSLVPGQRSVFCEYEVSTQRWLIVWTDRLNNWTIKNETITIYDQNTTRHLNIIFLWCENFYRKDLYLYCLVLFRTTFAGYTSSNFGSPRIFVCEKLSAMISKLFHCFIAEHCIFYSSWNTPQHVRSLGFQALVKT